MIRSNPLIEELAVQQHTEPGGAVVLVEIADAKLMPTLIPAKDKAGGASCGRARDRFAAGCRFPRGDRKRGVAFELHRLRLHPAGMFSCPALFIRDTGCSQKPVHNRVAPDFSLAGLIFELREHFLKTPLVDLTFECAPSLNVILDCFGAVIMRIV